MHSIGELARITGLSVRTIRFYSDSGAVPPTERSEAGYRRYDDEALARLELVRTLRDLGIGLATIRRVLDREEDVTAVAAAHADAIDAQIRTLHLRRSVLRVIAARASAPTDPKEMDTMNRLARMTESERRRIVEDFVDETFAGVEADPGFVAMMRSATPALPDDPSPEQIDAWIELAGLVADPAFRARVREMAVRGSGDPPSDPEAARHTAAVVNEKAGAARAQGIDPAAPEAGPVLNEIVGAFAAADARADDAAFRDQLRGRLETFSDERVERYWQLLGIINGWPSVPSTMGDWRWTIAALRAPGR